MMWIRKVLIVWALGAGYAAAAGLADGRTAEADFDNPPEAAKPWAYMWGSARNADAEDSARHVAGLNAKGFGGFVSYLGAPPDFARDPKFPRLLQEAERHGLVMGANNTGSWPAGGRWVSTPHLPWATVSSTVDLEGGRRFQGRLPEPPMPLDMLVSLKGRIRVPPEQYAQCVRSQAVVTVAVCAYPLPAATQAAPRVTVSHAPEGLSAMLDGSWNTFWAPAGLTDLPTQPPWICFDFGAPRTVEAIWLDGPTYFLERSDDGVVFQRINGVNPSRFTTFAPQRARYFRVVLRVPKEPSRWEPFCVRALALGTRAEVERRLQLAAKRSLNMLGVRPQNEMLAPVFTPLSPLPDDQPLAAARMVDLTGKVSADGTLDWEVPPGRWRVVWLCRSIATGYEAVMGLPDYLSAAAMREDWEKGMGKLVTAAGEKAGKAFRYLHEDNNEIHSVYNWTPGMLQEFRQRRGYDATPYLAAMAGEIVDSAEITDRFLADMRRTMADCVAQNHYGEWTRLAHERGMLTRSEAGGQYDPRVLPHDGMANLARVDLMVGEFWVHCTWKENWPVNGRLPTDLTERMITGQNYDVKQVASTSHLYGKPVVDMEAFTSFGYWNTAPADLLLHANVAFCEGVNHMSFHASDTTDSKEGSPGSTYVGTHFNDKNTWWPQLGTFTRYIQRCSALLQRGVFVADALYYIGDEVPAQVYSKHVRPNLGFGYDYDECNSEALLTCLTVKDGRLVARSGTRYRVLILPDRPFLTLPVARKIQEFVAGGVPVIGPKPTRTPGLSGYPQCDGALRALADRLWGDGRPARKGWWLFRPPARVLSDTPEKDVLAAQGVPPDFAFTGAPADALLDFIHRQDGAADIYFVINRRDRTERVKCSFRVTGKRPELWNAVDGSRRDLPQFECKDGRTIVPLELAANGSAFVVFRLECGLAVAGTPLSVARLDAPQRPAERVERLECGGLTPLSVARLDAPHQTDGRVQPRPDKAVSSDRTPKRNFPAFKPVMELAGPWRVQFDAKWGGPKEPVAFEKLSDWTTSPIEGLKYYSGMATYRTTFQSPIRNPISKIFLDLGTVHQLAVVRLNGKSLGVVWCAPWRVEITAALKPGRNDLEIDVVNTWANRLALDATLPPQQRLTDLGRSYAAEGLRGSKAPPQPSGLLGPVRVLQEEIERDSVR